MWGRFYFCEECGFAVDDDRALEAKIAAALQAPKELHRYRNWVA